MRSKTVPQGAWTARVASMTRRRTELGLALAATAALTLAAFLLPAKASVDDASPGKGLRTPAELRVR
jgi:hypothetical protein